MSLKPKSYKGTKISRDAVQALLNYGLVVGGKKIDSEKVEPLQSLLDTVPDSWQWYHARYYDLKPMSGCSYTAYRAIDPETGEVEQIYLTFLRA
jgi:hypothetical protein